MIRSGSSGSSTRLSKRKSLWIRHGARRRPGWCAASQPVTVDQSPVSSVRARANRSVQPATWRATYPSPRPRSASPATPRRRRSAGRRARRRRVPHRVETSLGVSVPRQVAAQDGALELLHHVELRADHRLVVAEARPSSATSGNTGAQRRLDAVLAAHVVGALGLRAGRRAAQDQVTGGVAQQVGQVGGAAGELAHLGDADQVRRRTPARARAATRATAADVERVLLADRRAGLPCAGSSDRLMPAPSAWPPGRASPRRTPRGRAVLSRHALARRLVGNDQLVTASMPASTAAAMSSGG